jgi:Uncharacterised protein family (UPF0175)
MISQSNGAEIAGLSRADFLDALFRANVPACQVTIEELKEELESWQRLSGESSTPERPTANMKAPRNETERSLSPSNLGRRG